jgi:hypothetical protein
VSAADRLTSGFTEADCFFFLFEVSDTRKRKRFIDFIPDLDLNVDLDLDLVPRRDLRPGYT